MKSSASNRASTSPEISSAPFIGQWRKLVSTTNWEKGRIVSEWRAALTKGGAKPSESSDEAWSKIVGGVTPQHVGRLRRVYDRFGALHDTFEGLFWSHFHASLDWEDAEMWLEGAIQNDWSVSQMRRQRWETLGGEEPRDEEIVASEIDEDLPPYEGDAGFLAEIRGHDPGKSPAGDGAGKDASAASRRSGDESAEIESEQKGVNQKGAKPEAEEAHAPFSGLAPLPIDLQDAFDNFKLAILRHKMTGWRDASRDDVLDSLEALKDLVLST